MDTGALKKAPPETIRILVWLLSFLGFGYATAEFEVTSERLGVYRPEEHIESVRPVNGEQARLTQVATPKTTTMTRMHVHMTRDFVDLSGSLNSRLICRPA